MNERIKQLAEQANLEIDPAHPDHNQKVLEKFAELIVKKCANIVWDEAEKTMSSEVNDAGYKIIEYFGVKQ
jgi:hypothetical protein